VNLEVPESASDFGDSAYRAFLDLGGVDLARRAESNPGVRADTIGPLVERLGLRDLEPGADDDAMLAAAELCRAAGRTMLPYPVVAVLGRDADGRPTALVAPGTPRADHGDLFAEWRTATLQGDIGVGRPIGHPLGTKLGPFVVDLTVAAASGPPVDIALLLTLDAWRTLGALEQALALTVSHVTTREQFGRPLAQFQAVQFQVADAQVAVDGLAELAKYTAWSVATGHDERVADALALRVAAVQAATLVMRTAHQLHGAIGFCDEHDLSVLSRHLQPQLRMPAGVEATMEALDIAVAEHGFRGLFTPAAEVR
jgi:Acyl-CoA dehydrogenase, C-terminal domain